MLSDALGSSLDLPTPASSPSKGDLSSPDLRHSTSSNPSPSLDPISPPPRAHHAPHPPQHLRPALRPRLVSQLTRATLPTASLTYASAEDTPPRHQQRSVSYHVGQSSSSNQRQRSVSFTTATGTFTTGALSSSPTGERLSNRDLIAASIEHAFPDLDPTTGLPLDQSPSRRRRRSSVMSDASLPSLHIQRTITDLNRQPTSPTLERPGPSFPLMGGLALPKLPPLPPILKGSRSSGEISGQKRDLSTTASSSIDWTSWKPGWWNKNKDQVDPMLSEEDQAGTVAEEQKKHQLKYKTPKDPLIFCHGLLGFDILGPAGFTPLQISHWRGIREVLEANGVEVLICRVPATSSIAERAATLNDLIAEKYTGRTVNLIGHSMGGLDCRYLISMINPHRFQVASLTTISTPHRGSPFADYVIDDVIGRERLPQLIGMMESLQLPNQGDGAAFAALRTNAMKEFNTQVVDDPNVMYYSWGASFEPGLFDTFRWPHSVIMAKEGPNDGMVSVHSARWGEYRGTLNGVNHLDLVGWVNQVRYILSDWSGNPITFKPATFYLEISNFLAEQGF
ncbi:Lipase 2 [Vanrija pseudolonga]|uniref:GPI inositol-deacylase n=1 Tax=Vanrija pseudolonga TaxID=143232 RepID=A0AAF0Y667_9TREE|nr:Lipase 2 [Vanrija pseudolonga]